MRHWPRRRWAVAVVTAVSTVLAVALPTAMIPTPIFGREVPVTSWSWPVLLATAVLSGLVTATYVRAKNVPVAPDDGERQARTGLAGGLLTFFAVGAIALLGWALRVRLRGERACALTG